MTTDSGLVYLSGLLRAGAEPLGPAPRAERRRAAVSPHESRFSDHSVEDAAGQAAHVASGHASEGDAPAGFDGNEDAEEAVALKSSEAAGDRYTPSPDVPLGESAVNSLPDDAVEGVEQHVHAQIQSRAAPPSTRGVRATSEMNRESRAPAASPAAPDAGEARTHPTDYKHIPDLPADEIRGGEAERTAVVTEQSHVAASGEELIPATRRLLDVERQPATLHGESSDPAVTRSEIVSAVEGSARHTSKAKTADEVVMKTDEAPDARGGSLLLPVASSVRGPSARRDTSPARASQASPEEGSPTFTDDRARVSEGGAEPNDARSEPAAGPAPFTLEAHVEQLRALMQTARAETPDEEGGAVTIRPPAVVASHHTKPLTTAARPAPEQSRTALRPELEARPETPTPAANLVERQRAALVNPVESQPVVLVNQEPPGMSSGRSTSVTEAWPITPHAAPTAPPIAPTTPRAAWARPGGVSPARVRGVEMTPAQSAPARTAGASSDTQDSAPTVATNSTRVVPVPSSEGASKGAATGGGRPPKFTINRLDVQVVGRQEPPPTPPPPATPAAESPPRADPWGALDRQLLGRFSY